MVLMKSRRFKFDLTARTSLNAEIHTLANQKSCQISNPRVVVVIHVRAKKLKQTRRTPTKK